jgi:hypothetical protein
MQTEEPNAKSQVAFGVSVVRALVISACVRMSITPRRARVQRRGRQISEKALVILQFNEAFENTELPPVEQIDSATTRFNRRV